MFDRKIALCLAAMAMMSTAASITVAADHLDAPELRQQGMGGRDINDVYVFRSPNDSTKSVLAMTVNPFAGIVNPFGTVSSQDFDPAVDYQIQIDNNGDAVADVTYSMRFTAPVGGLQTLTTTRNGVIVGSGATGSDIAVSGGGMMQAGLYDDPFFFDLVGFNNGFAFTGTNTFAGANVSAIVLEVPSAQLQDGGNTHIGVWARTVEGGNQVDRMGRPAINTALIPKSKKDSFNHGAPSTDTASFANDATASILGLNGNDAAHATAVAGALLPDVIAFDTSSGDGFLNGRKLSDDVIDAELNLLSKGGVTTDMVNSNDVAFRSQFPYLAPANAVPEPNSATILLIAAACGMRSVRRRTVVRPSESAPRRS